MLYYIGRQLIRWYLTIFYKWKIYGRNNIPKSGPVILIANHISNLDPTVVGSSVKRHVHFLAKEELFRIPVLGFLLYRFGSFPIKRGGNDRKAIKKGLHLLKEHRVIGIFPEGTRSKTGEIGKGLPGAALFALKSDAVVIPIGIISTYKLFKPLIVNVGQPIDLNRYRNDKITSDVLEEVITEMMRKVQVQVREISNI